MPQNPILLIKAPILDRLNLISGIRVSRQKGFRVGFELQVVWDFGLCDPGLKIKVEVRAFLALSEPR